MKFQRESGAGRRLSWIVLFVGGILLQPGSLSAVAEVEQTRNGLKEWIELEREIVRESTDWAAESVILTDRINLLKTERTRLQEQIEEARDGVGEVDRKREEINAQRDAVRAVGGILQEPLADLETRARALYSRLPQPLQEETVRLYQRIPEDSATTRMPMAERLQAVVGLLNFVDKFNSGVQREVEIRDHNGGQVEVDTLYFGLAAAFFSDANGTLAGIGRPGEAGWEWQSVPESSAAIARLLAVYRGTREAGFSAVPVTILQP